MERDDKHSARVSSGSSDTLSYISNNCESEFDLGTTMSKKHVITKLMTFERGSLSASSSLAARSLEPGCVVGETITIGGAETDHVHAKKDNNYNRKLLAYK